MRDRRTGQTLAMVRRLVPGAIVIVPHAALRSYVKDMIGDVHGAPMINQVRVLVISSHRDVARLYGLAGPIEIDHAFDDLVPASLACVVHGQIARIRSTIDDRPPGGA